MIKPYLPQHDPDAIARQHRLIKNRTDYVLDYNYLPPIPLQTPVPQQERFSAEYTARRLASFANLIPNMVMARARNAFDPLDTLEEYEDLLPVLPKPTVIKNYQADWCFAEQRLSGINPPAIRRIDALPENFPISNSLFQQSVGAEHNLERALKEGKLYFLDSPLLSGIKGGNYQNLPKYLPKPQALFYWRSDRTKIGGSLVPVAIKILGESGGENLVYTPNDAPLDWFLAKTCVQMADANHQELGTHFAKTHAVMAPIAAITARELGENHPLSLLLKPHFRFMLFDNELGRTQFLQPTGPTEELLAGTLEESLQLVAQAYEEWSIDITFPLELQQRHMDDPEILPHYPFRDDGILVWNAIYQFVTEYLQIYYHSPQDISADYELQNWTRELVNSGRVKGMPQSIDTLAQLIDIIAVVIFTCAPLHSCLNLAQYEYMTFVPNMPYAAYHPIPTTKGVDMATIVKIMPPFQRAIAQILWTDILSAFQYDKLGFYDEDFVDPKAQAVLQRFQDNLQQVEAKIDRQNQIRPVPYNYLKPSRIMNSINT